MPRFLAGNSTEITMWFWLFARFLEAIVLLISGFIEYCNISIRVPRTGSFLLATLISILSVYLISNRQVIFKESWVATDSHFISGIIIVLLLGAMVLFCKKLKRSGQKNDRLIICGIVTAIFSEIALSVHSVESDAFNLLGHLYKVVSYGFIFHVLFSQTVRKPFSDLENLLNQTVAAVSRALDRRDQYTFNHSVRVAEYACVIGQVMQVDKQLKTNLRLSGLLHDIGKIAIPDSVLNKNGPLTDEERRTIQLHPAKGAEILGPVRQLQVLRGVTEHHERVDGRGYPKGKAGEAISLEARILAVADTFDAITSNRVYRAGKSKQEAIKILQEVSGTQLDGQVVQAFIRADQAGLIDPIMLK